MSPEANRQLETDSLSQIAAIVYTLLTFFTMVLLTFNVGL